MTPPIKPCEKTLDDRARIACEMIQPEIMWTAMSEERQEAWKTLVRSNIIGTQWVNIDDEAPPDRKNGEYYIRNKIKIDDGGIQKTIYLPDAWMPIEREQK